MQMLALNMNTLSYVADFKTTGILESTIAEEPAAVAFVTIMPQHDQVVAELMILYPNFALKNGQAIARPLPTALRWTGLG